MGNQPRGQVFPGRSDIGQGQGRRRPRPLRRGFVGQSDSRPLQPAMPAAAPAAQNSGESFVVRFLKLERTGKKSIQKIVPFMAASAPAAVQAMGERLSV